MVIVCANLRATRAESGRSPEWIAKSKPSSMIVVGLSDAVSAGAKIPIVPVEFSPPLNVVNRSPLHTEEVPKLVKGERRARTKRTATARDEHPDDQQADRLGPQDHSQVYEGGGGGAGIWPTLSTTEQTRCV